MSDDRKVIRVSTDSEVFIKAYAEKKGVPVGEAADMLIATAQSRLETLARYGKNAKKAERKPAKKKAAAKKEAKPRAKAKSKSNGAAQHAEA